MLILNSFSQILGLADFTWWLCHSASHQQEPQKDFRVRGTVVGIFDTQNLRKKRHHENNCLENEVGQRESINKVETLDREGMSNLKLG